MSVKKTAFISGITFSLALLSVEALADRTTVDGRTFECTDSCTFNSGAPMTISDCCGGRVEEILKREIIIIDTGT